MTNEAGFKKALADLQHMKSKFGRTINEVIALRHLVEDALRHEQATDDDCEKLQSALENLTELRKDYEVRIETFNTTFALEHLEEVGHADKLFEEHQKAYLNIRLTVTRLIRQARKQIAEQRQDNLEDSGSESEEKLEGGKEEESKQAEDDQKSNNALNGDASEAQEAEENEKVNDKKDGEDVEANNDEPPRVNYCRKVALYIVIVIVFYGLLGLIISVVLNSNKDSRSENTIRPKLQGGSNDTCGENSFQIRDSVCDDTSNTAKCLFDGGDCCLEFKETRLCKNCTCILFIDHDELRNQFVELDIKPLENPTDLVTAIGNDWIVQVKDVLNGQVCARLCLEHESKDNINSWHYHEDSMVCKCGWVKSYLCLEEMTIPDWSLDNNVIQNSTGGFVQRCIAAGFLINSYKSHDAQEDHSEASALTKSLWHCMTLCGQYSDCTWFSWRKAQADSNGHECRMMKALPDDQLSSKVVEPDWISSSRNCTLVESHFSKYSNTKSGIHFACPRNPKMIATEPEPARDFVISVNGWTGSSTEVYKADADSLVECTHSLLALRNSLQGATGGILKRQEDSSSSEVLDVVICGGETFVPGTVIEDLFVNDECYKLNTVDPFDSTENLESAVGSLQVGRMGAASLVINNGQTLWITGGKMTEAYENSVESTELLIIDSSEAKSSFSLVNEPGPDLPLRVNHHCLVGIGTDFALVIGGENHRDLVFWEVGVESSIIGTTLFMNLALMSGTAQASLHYGRAKHACGTIMSDKGDEMVVAAGGITEFSPSVDSVELLHVVEDEHPVLASHWVNGPSMPIPLIDAAGATASSRKAFYVFGGLTNQEDLNGTPFVFKLKCATKTQCVWAKLDQEMKAPNARGVALTLQSFPLISPGYASSRNCSLRANESLLVLTTGTNGRHDLQFTDTLVITLKRQRETLARCYPHELKPPVAVAEATGGVLRPSLTSSNDYTPIICGGASDNGEGKVINENCYTLTQNQSEPARMISAGRVGAASVVILGGTRLWVTGGWNPETSHYCDFLLDSTELVSLSVSHDLTIRQGPKLAEPTAYHCLQMINEHLAIVYGGQMVDYYNGCFTRAWKRVWTYHFDENESGGEWTPQPEMLEPRMHHSCGVLRMDAVGTKVVVAAGGEGETGAAMSDVEFLRVDKNGQINQEWEFGPHLPKKLKHTGSATAPDQGMLYVAGGRNHFEDVGSNLVFYLFCVEGDCQWSIDYIKLQYQRNLFVAMIIPARNPDATVDYSKLFESYEDCPGDLIHDWIADGFCDDDTNIAECDYDGGDCCNMHADFDYCTECFCFEQSFSK